MNCKLLVVEDEIFVAVDIENTIVEMGNEVVGLAADYRGAMALADKAEVALVDLNLRDGATGAEIGRQLACDHGVTVIYLTANPCQLGDGIPGTLGVISKPIADDELQQVVNYAVAMRRNENASFRPPRLQIFNPEAQAPATSPAAEVSQSA